MLKKLTSVGGAERLVLLCDSAVWQAQIAKARRLVDADLEDASENDLLGEMLRAVRASAGPGADITKALTAIRVAGAEVITKIFEGEEQIKAAGKLRDALSEEDMRTALAWVRAQAAAAQYRESSDLTDLLDPDPAEATGVHIKPLTKESLRKFDRGYRLKPALGELQFSRASDVARRAQRRGEDAGEAYSSYVSALPAKDQKAIDDFENWSFDRDCELFSLSVEEVGGFPLFMEGGRFPVAEFINQCVEAESVVTEVARHVRNLSTLGKPGACSALSMPGKGVPESGQRAPQTAGPAANAQVMESEQSRRA
mgnify:CR=1 FL=1|tara:strand:- start:5489 stop:6424 length:936 start_codon:yes stop_codon:yes gene_type:complete